MKKNFEIPTVEIIKFRAEDVLTTSAVILREDELEIYELN